jgi:cytochrome bd ubiquinol oxidase subunit I
VGGSLERGAAVRHEYGRLAADRERPAAVDLQGIMLTKNGISPTVSVTWLWISLVGFIALYGTLGTVDLILMLRYSRKELEPERTDADTNASVPAVQY